MSSRKNAKGSSKRKVKEEVISAPEKPLTVTASDGGGISSRDMNIVEWLDYHSEQGISIANIQKENLRTIIENCVSPYKKKFSTDYVAHARRTKAVVTQLHQTFTKTIETLSQLDATMLKEFNESFPGIDEDWSHDACSIVSSSSLTGEILRCQPQSDFSSEKSELVNDKDVHKNGESNKASSDDATNESMHTENNETPNEDVIPHISDVNDTDDQAQEDDPGNSGPEKEGESDGSGYASDRTSFVSRGKVSQRKSSRISEAVKVKKEVVEEKKKKRGENSRSSSRLAIKEERVSPENKSKSSKKSETGSKKKSDISEASEEEEENEIQVDAIRDLEETTDINGISNSDEIEEPEASQSLLDTSLDMFGEEVEESVDSNIPTVSEPDLIPETQLERRENGFPNGIPDEETLERLGEALLDRNFDYSKYKKKIQKQEASTAFVGNEDDIIKIVGGDPPSPSQTVIIPRSKSDVAKIEKAKSSTSSAATTSHKSKQPRSPGQMDKNSPTATNGADADNEEDNMDVATEEGNNNSDDNISENTTATDEVSSTSKFKTKSENENETKKEKSNISDFDELFKTSAVEIIDDEKPSTSKKARAELARNQRRSKKLEEEQSKLTKDEQKARRMVLDSSSEDEEKPIVARMRKKGTSEKKKSQESLKKDPKLLTMKAVVKLIRLAPQIEQELKTTGYITFPSEQKPKKKNDDDDEDMESDSSLSKLDKAIRELARYDPCLKEKSNRKGSSSKKGKELKNRRRGSDSDEQLLSAEEGETKRGPITKMGGKVSDSDIEELESLSENDEKDKKKKASSEDKKTTEKNSKEKKNYVTPGVGLSSDDSDADERRKALEKDSDDSSDEIGKKSKKTKKKDSDNDSDINDLIGNRRLRSRKKTKKLKLLSDSEGSPKNSDSEDESDIVSDSVSVSDDSDFNDKKRKRKEKGKRGHSSSTDEDRKKKKKKRKRIKEEHGSDDDSDASKVASNDSDIEEIGDIPASQRRKKIRGIMGKKDLQKSTREAEKEEEERKKRVIEQQKLFNGMFETPTESDTRISRLVLDIDPETKEPRIEVDESIVSKLKPHQVNGVKFMFTTCFESVEMIKKGKAGGCILAHCMGLGKTLQTIAFTQTALSHQELTGTRTVLVLCPLNTVNNWFKEYQQWLDDVETEKKPKLHTLYDTKNIPQRIDALRVWQKRGGVGIMHYDMFRALVGYATGKGKKAKAAHKEAIVKHLLDPGPDMVICDEGHLLKNCKSKLSEALRKVKTIRRVVLTGTPLQNNLVEYHTMVDFVKPNLLGTLKEFTNRFVNPIKNGQCKDSSERDVKTMKRRAHVLHSKLDGCVQRLDYTVLTPYLPPKHEYCIIIKLSDKQKQLYRSYLDSQVPTDSTERARGLLKHYSVLIKILAHPVVLTMKKAVADSGGEEEDDEGSLKDFIDDRTDVDNTSSGSDIDWLDEESKKVEKRKTRSCKEEPKDADEENTNGSANKESLGSEWWSSFFEKKEELEDVNLSGKLVVLQEILKICETIGDKVLVFSQYLTTLNIIEEFLNDWDEKAKIADKDKIKTFPPIPSVSAGRWRDGIEYFRIDGQTKTSDRQRHCDVFNKKAASKAKLFLISTKAGGLGINLFGANRVVIFDASWNPSNDMQSIFRVYRFGQSKPCYIYRFVAQATMEEKIYNRQVVKLSLSSRVIDEHQVERHFKFDDISEMYKFNPDEKTERPTPPLPKDRLLADLLISHTNWIDSYFEHDSLLVNKEDEVLTEEERKQAWEEYQFENERRDNPTVGVDFATLQKLKLKLKERFPTAAEADVHNAAMNVLSKINELQATLRRFHQFQASMSPSQRQESQQTIEKLQNFIKKAVGSPADVPQQYSSIPQMSPQMPFAMPQMNMQNMSLNQVRALYEYSQRQGLPVPSLQRLPNPLNSNFIPPVPIHNNMLQSVARALRKPEQSLGLPSYTRVTPYNPPNNPGEGNSGTSDEPVTLD